MTPTARPIGTLTEDLTTVADLAIRWKFGPAVECWFDKEGYWSTFGRIEAAPAFVLPHDNPLPTMLGRESPPPIMIFSLNYIRTHTSDEEIKRGVTILRITQGEWTYRLHNIRWRDNHVMPAALGVWPD